MILSQWKWIIGAESEVIGSKEVDDELQRLRIVNQGVEVKSIDVFPGCTTTMNAAKIRASVISLLDPGQGAGKRASTMGEANL